MFSSSCYSVERESEKKFRCGTIPYPYYYELARCDKAIDEINTKFPKLIEKDPERQEEIKRIWNAELNAINNFRSEFLDKHKDKNIAEDIHSELIRLNVIAKEHPELKEIKEQINDLTHTLYILLKELKSNNAG
jgi:transketolase